jgi:hypothetical protein
LTPEHDVVAGISKTASKALRELIGPTTPHDGGDSGNSPESPHRALIRTQRSER